MARRSSVAALLVLVTVVTGCAGATSQALESSALPNPATAVVGRAFGDSGTFGPRILSFDRDKELATAAVKSAGYGVVLAVIPGRDIEVIQVGRSIGKRDRETVLQISMQRFRDDPKFADTRMRDQQTYERCLAAAGEALRRQGKATQKRDSTGKVIGGGSDAQIMVDADMAASSRCGRVPNSQKPPQIRVPQRPAAERYLVLLVGSTALTSAFVTERLGTLTAVGSDVATTIEAIAAGLYAGSPGTWAGCYVAW